MTTSLVERAYHVAEVEHPDKAIALPRGATASLKFLFIVVNDLHVSQHLRQLERYIELTHRVVSYIADPIGYSVDIKINSLGREVRFESSRTMA
ncbi:Hypothetical predicted protein [Olea europaea subsp. europaea]|uniref:Uncharacterized protein n=1 Tax=Olea europaea subsp. europaea TaxID=158383 RepID=A0A8S0VFW6_OLEEU|nr:Hypothetical predicted protein [Olea europaea subsp. europaea]